MGRVTLSGDPMRTVKTMIRRAGKAWLNRMLKPVHHVCVHERALVDFYLHEYDSYEDYRAAQVFHNKRKLDHVWADRAVLQQVADILTARFTGRRIRGLCHGARNGFEQQYLRELCPELEATGTDISETAEDFAHSIQWDFHDQRPDWVGAFDFVYSNSLDQAWKPQQAVRAWLDQLTDDGVLILEHSESHGPAATSAMDPFGVRPVAMPYILTLWFGDEISISHTMVRKENYPIDAWLFVISKNPAGGSPWKSW